MKKASFLFVVTVILSLLLAACQPQATATPAPEEPAATETSAATEAATAPAKEITITYWAFGSEGAAMNESGELWTDWYNKVFEDYKAEHPNVTIDFSVKGYDASGTTLFIDTAVAAGTPPDVYFDTKFRVKKYFDAGLMEDLGPALTDADLAAYDPAVFAGSKSGDMVWSIPASGGYWNMIVNKSLFEKAGKADLLPQAPDYSWTTEEFMTACKAINDPANSVYCTYFSARAGPKYTNPKTQFESYFLSFTEGARLELMQAPNVEARQPNEARPAGYAHLAFSVGSQAGVDELTARLEADGYPIPGRPRWTGDGYYESVVLDPDGNRVEITA